MARSLLGSAQAAGPKQARWSSPENVHLTLVFLGEVKEETYARILDEFRLLPAPSLEMRLRTFGTFPNAGVFFAEVDPLNALLELQMQVVHAMERCGFSPEQRPYHPHITLGRFRPPLQLRGSELVLPPSVPRIFPVSEMNLYRSHQGAEGSQYEVLATRRAK